MRKTTVALFPQAADSLKRNWFTKEQYKDRLTKFEKFLTGEITYQNKELISLYLNDLEIYLLSSLMNTLQIDSNDKDNGILNEDNLIFYLTQSLFLRQCKIGLKVERESNEFVQSLTDTLLPMIKKIVEKIDLNAANIIFNEQAHINMLKSTPGIFHKHIDSSIQSFIKKTKSSILNTAVQALYTGTVADLNEIREYLTTNYLNVDKFPTTWGLLYESLQYRYEKHRYLVTKLEKEYQQTKANVEYKRQTAKKDSLLLAQEFNKIIESNAANLESSIDDILADKTIIQSEIELLQTMKKDFSNITLHKNLGFDAIANNLLLMLTYANNDEDEIQAELASQNFK